MKILATIESVKVTRKVKHKDDTWGNVYGIQLVAGDDKILAESFRSDESLKKAGIVPGAIGTVQLEFNVSEGISKAGNPYCIQNITLRNFELPRDTRQQGNGDAPSDAAPTPEAAPEEGAEEGKVDSTQLPY